MKFGKYLGCTPALGALTLLTSLTSVDQIPPECTFDLEYTVQVEPREYDVNGANIDDIVLVDASIVIREEAPIEIALGEEIKVEIAPEPVEVLEPEYILVDHYYENEMPFYGNISVGGVIGKGAGVNSSYGSTSLFLSPCDFTPGHFQPFFDFRSHFLDDGQTAFNVGTGVRFLNDCSERIFGFNVYYDYYRNHGDFNQIGLGFESLGSCYDFRVNGYLPVGDKISRSDCEFTAYSHDYWVKGHRSQEALSGLDAEFERHQSPSCNRFGMDLYAALGVYYYQGGSHQNVAGAKFRMGLNYLDYFNFEIRDSFDSVFHNRLQGVISINFPFGCKTIRRCNDCITEKLVQPVVREEIIKFDKKHQQWKTNF